MANRAERRAFFQDMARQRRRKIRAYRRQRPLLELLDFLIGSLAW